MTQNEAKSIINAYNSGVVPQTDLIANFVVGRERLLKAVSQVLDDTAGGGSTMKFLCGDPGYGKSSVLYLTKMASWAKGFVTLDADFSTDIRLYDGGGGKALALYKALMNSVSVKTRKRGGALPLVLEVGINNIVADVAAETGMEKARLMDSENMDLVLEAIDKCLQNVDGIDSADFNSVVKSYFRGFLMKDSTLKNDAVKWLRGDCESLVEARQKLGVRKVVDDGNWYEMLKNFCAYAVHVGRFNGLTVLLDEAARICDIIGKDTRNKNIEKVLYMYNDCFQHRNDHLLIMMAGTRNLLENMTRGLQGMEPLRGRLAPNEYLKDGLVDYSGPEFPVEALTEDSALTLFERLKSVFDTRYGITLPLTKEDIRAYRDSLYKDAGSRPFLSPRKLAMKFLDLMEVMRQNDLSFQEVIKENR